MNVDLIPERVVVRFHAEPPRRIREVVREVRQLGGRISQGVLVFLRDDEIQEWQLDAFADIELSLAGHEQVPADKWWDDLALGYPLTAVPASWAPRFAEVAVQLASRLGLPMRVEGAEMSESALLATLADTIAGLSRDYADPGTLELRMLVALKYG